MIHDHIFQDPVVHHGINAAAVLIPTVSFLLQAPPYLTVLLSLLGIVWYTILIAEKLISWLRKR
jgi:hypothetical protein